MSDDLFDDDDDDDDDDEETEVVVRASPFQKDPYVQLTNEIALPRICLQYLQERLGLRLSKAIVGVGKFGVALEACTGAEQQTCTYVVKVVVLAGIEHPLQVGEYIKFGRSTSRREFELEAKIARQMGEIEVGPRVLSYFICPNTVFRGDPLFVSGIIVSERMDMTVTTIIVVLIKGC